MEKIPTAEEFLDLQHKTVTSTKFDIRQVMIEFAKLHAEAALKAASESVCTLDSILNSYPPENIK